MATDLRMHIARVVEAAFRDDADLPLYRTAERLANAANQPEMVDDIALSLLEQVMTFGLPQAQPHPALTFMRISDGQLPSQFKTRRR